MRCMTAAMTDIDCLLDEVLGLSVPLHRAIAHFDEPGARYVLAGAPGVAIFIRDGGDTIAHESSSPSPTIAPALDDLKVQHLARVGVADSSDNSHVPALLLLCLALADEHASTRFDLRSIARRPAAVVALDEAAGRHDPDLQPHDVALRAWTPLTAEHAPEAGVHTAVLQWHFSSQRRPRYAPW